MRTSSATRGPAPLPPCGARYSDVAGGWLEESPPGGLNDLAVNFLTWQAGEMASGGAATRWYGPLDVRGGDLRWSGC